ncbi:MAG: tetratricopeptide repeat protein [Bacteroidales bacterium]|nr:tetratricopeptide repeat protein [Bacteroidales bacterium]
MGRYLKSNNILIVLATGLLLYSCSVEKNTGLSRFYHNLTSNYNIYFNGNEAFLEGMEKIKQSYKDDYATLIPIFEYSDENAARSAVGDMERAINKASKLISLHSMTASPEMDSDKPLTDKEKEFYDRKEYNDWVDDSYLLMGKAQLLKHDYNNARITLLHNIRETHDEEMRIRSMIWLARTYTEAGNYNEAGRLLSEIDPQPLDDELQAEYYLSLADMHMRRQQYERAIPALENALDNIKGKKNKNRPAYILARLYEETGNSTLATKYYKKVLKLNPPYEMEFNARISQAGVFDVESGDVESIRKELDKLLRDDKNKEYLDQIYFAHGNLSMREGNTGEAIDYYHRSAAASTNNNNQKGRSYLMLAEHYYDKPDYHLAQMYYDSAVTFLDKQYPGYNDYNRLSSKLNELTSYLDIVSREDSLQYVASLSPSEIDNIINGIIREIEQEEREAAMPEGGRYNMGQFYENQRRFRDNIEASGKWYFYNQSALTFGRTEFRNRWGDRQLEDNWRRRNKSSTGAVGGSSEDAGQAEEEVDVTADIKSKEYYLKNLPLNDSLMAESDRKMADALFNAAQVYHEKFNDYEKAKESYTSFISRFPDNPRVPHALYNIYSICKDRDPQLAESHKERLISRHPESEYAKILSDPDYLKTRMKEANRAEEMYNSAFSLWKNGDMEAAIAICNRAPDEFPQSELLPKFMLLKAYAMGPALDEKSLKDELLRITDMYPGTDEAARASEMIAHINEKVPELKEEDEREIAVSLYDTLQTPPYRFMLVIMDKDLDINRLTFDVINYNIDNYTNENYNTRGELVDDEYISITVGTFPGIGAAMDYYKSFSPADILRNTGETEIFSFIISSSNYESLIRDKNAGRYYLFFRENYPE